MASRALRTESVAAKFYDKRGSPHVAAILTKSHPAQQLYPRLPLAQFTGGEVELLPASPPAYLWVEIA
jgi:hypothetical protein